MNSRLLYHRPVLVMLQVRLLGAKIAFLIIQMMAIKCSI